ncbi:hypothetical protein [Bailinhaonella thermotolerans]|uniref:hypothetical protein n=1 Tax=Bailinhaonella thermotolerans TaxID=1070861 RepID=UPI0011C47EB0|nr:hypothetical protein [Bailinhaonella thermotolerans]
MRVVEYLGAGSTGKNSAVSSKTVTTLTGLVSVEWGRRLEDTSEATVTLAQSRVSAACCRALSRFENWFWDLLIFRDSELVWRGPILDLEETGQSIVIHARDLSAWLERRSWVAPYGAALPSNPDLAAVAHYNLIGAFVADPELPTQTAIWTRPNIPAITSYTPSGIKLADTDLRLSEDSNAREDLDETAKFGLDWTTHVDKILISGEASTSTPAAAWLSADDFAVPLQVAMQGSTAGTAILVYGGASGDVPALYWRGLDRPPVFLEPLRVNSTTMSDADKTEIGKSVVLRNFPPARVVRVPDGAPLTPAAPIPMAGLVCGRRINVSVDSRCWPASAGYRLSQVAVKWSQAGEQVGVTFAPLVQPR